MRTSVLLILLVTALAACSGDHATRSEGGRVPVAATLYPVASILQFVGEGAVDVHTILPPGAHPDTYEATPRVGEMLAGAALVVRVGGPADDWLVVPAGTKELILTAGMPLIHERGPGTGNPHVWLDPILVRDSLLPRMAAALTAVAPDSSAAIRARAAAFADSLTALDAWIRETLAPVRGARFVAAHPAWVYFARRYGLEEVGSLHPSPGTELGTRDLARLVNAARDRGVAAVIAEPQLGAAGTEALARELQLPVAVADPVGGPELDGREDYLSLMRYNVRAFARALASHAPGARGGRP